MAWGRSGDIRFIKSEELPWRITFKVIAVMLRERKLLDVIYAGYRGQGGEIGRRARLRITKSSISKRSFSFQKTIDLRE